MKRYEGLFILSHTVREEAIKTTIDKIEAAIKTLGGQVETVQKMDKRPFSRVADKRHPAGFYVNFIFEAPTTAPVQLRKHLLHDGDIFRMVFTLAPPLPKATATP